MANKKSIIGGLLGGVGGFFAGKAIDKDGGDESNSINRVSLNLPDYTRLLFKSVNFAVPLLTLWWKS